MTLSFTWIDELYVAAREAIGMEVLVSIAEICLTGYWLRGWGSEYGGADNWGINELGDGNLRCTLNRFGWFTALDELAAGGGLCASSASESGFELVSQANGV